MMKKIIKMLVMMTAVAGMIACSENGKKEPKQPEETKISVETPRSLVAHEGKIYASCYSPASVIRIDTATQKVEAICNLGDFGAEGIAISNGKIFVASGYSVDENYNYTYDNKVYVIDLKSFTVTTSLEVGRNPGKVVATDNGYVVVQYMGDYATEMAGVAVINTNTLDVRQAEGITASNMYFVDGNVYGYYLQYGAAGNPTAKYFKMDMTSLTKSDILGSFSVNNPYSIAKKGDKILISDDGNYAANGNVYYLNEDGTEMWHVEAGMLPSKYAFVDDKTAYVLNEGSWGADNASLSKVDLTTGEITNNVFASANGRGLGDVAQDILIYGSKAYISVSFSNTIEIVNIKDNKAKQITLK